MCAVLIIDFRWSWKQASSSVWSSRIAALCSIGHQVIGMTRTGSGHHRLRIEIVVDIRSRQAHATAAAMHAIVPKAICKEPYDPCQATVAVECFGRRR